MSATLLEIQRMSTEDGPGIRTTVFFKGCTLACTWCHNPESISPKKEVVWHDYKCIGCQTCVTTCPERALSLTSKGVFVEDDRCVACGTCTSECPTTAREELGSKWEVDDLVHEVAKDRTWFETSGGGVTASGGEPCLQAHFVADFFARCRELDIPVALDTCGMCSEERLLKVARLADLVLFDLKEIDSEAHQQFTGQPNERILENAVAVASLVKETGAGFWIRTPLIPGATATRDNISGIGQFIAKNLGDQVQRWELCSFNNLCQKKYSRLGLEWAFAEAELPAEDQQALYETARNSGVDPAIVVLTGPQNSCLTPGPTGSVGRDSSTENLCFESASVALRPRI
ncbi:MAG: glycyl-radical enzyme activating protein, partial [Proteobacteria bacterium]|nr:glycyl-radical enzyme activating protein [Pseudomonadota bacterium]